MGKITLIELNLEGASPTLNLPFSGNSTRTEGESEESDDVDFDVGEKYEDEAEDDSSGGKGKALALVGVLVFLVVSAALAKYMMGGDEEETEFDDVDRPVGVTVGQEDE